MKTIELMELSDSALAARLDVVKRLCRRAGTKSLVMFVVAFAMFGLEYVLEAFEDRFRPVIAYAGMGILGVGTVLSAVAAVVLVVKWWDLRNERWACRKLLAARQIHSS